MAGGASDKVAQRTVVFLRESAAETANRKADEYFSGMTDFRSQIKGALQAKPWENGTSPFTLELGHDQEALMTPEDKQMMHRFTHESFVQAIKDNPHEFVGLITGYARVGKSFFDEFD